MANNASFSLWNRQAFDGCLELANQAVTGETLLRLIGKERMRFDKHHFYMLLRELILARSTESQDQRQRISLSGLPLGYYVDWILYEVTLSESVEVRGWFIEAARSVVDQTLPTHRSPFYTAYRGFFMLARSGDIMSILRSLISEQGVTPHGIDLAAMLLGAAVGVRQEGENSA